MKVYGHSVRLWIMRKDWYDDGILSKAGFCWELHIDIAGVSYDNSQNLAMVVANLGK